MTVPSRPSPPAQPVSDAPCLKAATIVRLLGGGAAVSHVAFVAPSTVCGWRRIGIPRRYWAALIELARRTPGAEAVTLAALERHDADPALPSRSYGQTMTPDAIYARRRRHRRHEAACLASVPEYRQPPPIGSASSESTGAADAADQ